MNTPFSDHKTSPSPREVAADWLSREEAGPLSADERRRLEAWLEAEPANRTAYEEVAYVYGLADEHAAAPLIMSLRRSALETTGRRPARRGLAVAAAAAAAVALGWTTMSSNSGRDAWFALGRAAEALGLRADPKSAIYRTRVGERLTFNLPDGSVATLNTNSELKVAWSVEERGVRLLRGQALFEVAKNPDRPFRVYAGDRQITALGTVFDVRVEGETVRVALVEGAVRVASARRPANRTAPVQQVELSPGEVLQAARAAPMAVATADVRRVVTWKTGVVEFAGEPLAQAVAEMNRYTDRPIHIADASVGKLRISGVFRTGEPELFARMVSEVIPVDVQRGANGLTVLKGRDEQ